MGVVSVYESKRLRRVNGRRHRIPGKAGRKIQSSRLESRPLESNRSQLLSAVKEKAAARTRHRFPTRCIAKRVRKAEPRRKVEPRSFPQRGSLRGQRPIVGVRILE